MSVNMIHKLRRRVRLLRVLVKVNWQQETAYFGNTFAAVITPLMYCLSFLLFFSVLFQSVDSVAGYSRNEMFFLIFVGQLSFYSYNFWTSGVDELDTLVNTGALDHVLVRPLPAMFYVTVHKIRPLSGLVNFLGPLFPVWLVVDWGSLDLHWQYLAPVTLIFLAGVFLYQQFQFLTSSICFWTGRSKQANLIVYSASSQEIPLEGFNSGARRLFLGAVPVFFSSVVVSVMLGRSSPAFWGGVALAVLAVFSLLKKFIWRMAVRRYSSASS